MRRHSFRWFAAAIAVFALIAASCGDDADETTVTPAAPEEEMAEEAPMAEEEMAEEEAMEEPDEPEPAANPLDVTGDGQVTVGVATAGPRDDGAYYQELVNLAIEFSQVNGWADPVIIDLIVPAVAFNELENLVAQGVDIVAVGSGELSDAVPDIIEKYPDLIWFCNCGAGYPQTPGLITSRDDGAQIEYVAGYAAGLLLQERGGDTAYMIGCCDLGFEVETELAFRLGLKDVDPGFDVIYTPTGNFPFDFDNVAGATEAFNVALDAGMDAVYPYLGGAHEPLVQLANEHDVIVMSAGASDVCERTDLHWDMAVLFSAGDFARDIFEGIVDGTIQEGTVRFFEVGVDPEVGSKICGPTPEQEEALTQAHLAVAEGYCAEEFGLIQAIAYGGVEADPPERCA